MLATSSVGLCDRLAMGSTVDSFMASEVCGNNVIVRKCTDLSCKASHSIRTQGMERLVIVKHSHVGEEIVPCQLLRALYAALSRWLHFLSVFTMYWKLLLKQEPCSLEGSLHSRATHLPVGGSSVHQKSLWQNDLWCWLSESVFTPLPVGPRTGGPWPVPGLVNCTYCENSVQRTDGPGTSVGPLLRYF